ncbi:MAG: hypothetical protein IMF11_16365 [Proteobacteria bacterium]|nr:hypothetical protein [Pseudomonadota bacterium]
MNNDILNGTATRKRIRAKSEIKKEITEWWRCPQDPRGFPGIRRNYGYPSNLKKEGGETLWLPHTDIRRTSIRLSLHGSLPSVARFCFTGH